MIMETQYLDGPDPTCVIATSFSKCNILLASSTLIMKTLLSLISCIIYTNITTGFEITFGGPITYADDVVSISSNSGYIS